jgi:phenylalanyl-tRNA synthetase alpha subunit
MSWYYDEGGIERYHEWKFKEKQLERARKKKAILQEKEKKRKQKELKKLMKEEQRLRDIEERKIKRMSINQYRSAFSRCFDFVNKDIKSWTEKDIKNF